MCCFTDVCRCREIAGGIPRVVWAICNCPSFECASVPQCSAVFLEGIFQDLLDSRPWLPSVHVWFCAHVSILFLSSSYHLSLCSSHVPMFHHCPPYLVSSAHRGAFGLAGSWCSVGCGRTCPSCCPSRATCLRLLGAWFHLGQPARMRKSSPKVDVAYHTVAACIINVYSICFLMYLYVYIYNIRVFCACARVHLQS